MMYSLKSFNASTGSLIVSFDGFNDIALDVPIEGGAFLSGDKLLAYIKGFIPTWHADRAAELLVASGADVVRTMCLDTSVAELAVPSYAELRAKAYPPFIDFIDAVVKGDTDAITLHREQCLAVKALYPKPEPVLVSDEVLAQRRDL